MAHEIRADNKGKRYFVRFIILLMWGQGQQGYWSDYCGGQGGKPDEFVGKYSLVGVRGRSGADIDRLQFLFVDI